MGKKEQEFTYCKRTAKGYKELVLESVQLSSPRREMLKCKAHLTTVLLTTVHPLLVSTASKGRNTQLFLCPWHPGL